MPEVEFPKSAGRTAIYVIMIIILIFMLIGLVGNAIGAIYLGVTVSPVGGIILLAMSVGFAALAFSIYYSAYYVTKNCTKIDTTKKPLGLFMPELP